MNLIRYPDPLLSQRSEEVLEADLEAVRVAIEPMVKLMQQHQGAGLAAIQAGIARRFAVVDLSKDAYYDKATPAIMTVINPVIVNKKNPIRLSEGCLSLPLFEEIVDRFADITVTYRDENWVEHTKEFSGLTAQCLQHELLHLDGLLLTDVVSPMKQQMYKKKLRKKGVL